MPTHSTTGLYPEDLYCSNPNNLITDEVQTLQTPGVDDYYFIIPHAAPFYVETLKLRNHQTGTLYVEGVDYLVGHYFVDAMKSLKRPIAGSIRFLRKNITGQARIEYHTVGGQWGFSAQAILAELSNKQLNPIIRSWEQIDGLPARFPTIAHDQSVDQLTGSDDIVEAIEQVAAVMEAAAAGSSESHINDRNNPHGVTQAQVGLSDVVNLPLASLTQALLATFDGGYTTPRTVIHAINHFAVTPLSNHIADKNNPHETNKQQVGLGNVPNLPLANNEEAIDPLNNATFMSPYTTALMIQSLLPVNRIDNLELELQAFIGRRDNPHQVTAAQVGTLTTTQIQELIVSAGSGDAIRFGGYTIEQFMDLVVEETEMEAIFEAQGALFSANAIETGNLEVNFVADIAQLNTDRGLMRYVFPYAGDGAYTVSNENGEGILLHHIPNVPHNLIITWPGTVASLGGWLYAIGTNGGINHYGTAPAVQNEYNGTHPSYNSANAAQRILTTRTARYIFTDDERLIRSTGPANATVLHPQVNGVWANAEYTKPGEMVVYRTTTDTLAVYGDAGFAASLASISSAWDIESISDMAITDDHFAVLFSTGLVNEPAWEVEIYEIVRTGPTSLVRVNYPTEAPVAISGTYGHLGVVHEDGSVAFFGVLNACEDEIDVPVTGIACGAGFTVILDDRNNIEFWGDSPNNALVYNREVMYEHA